MTGLITDLPTGQALPTRFSASMVTRVVKHLAASSQNPRTAWLQAVAARVSNLRSDLSEPLLDVLGVEPAERDVLAGLTIGEIGVCYEALLAEINSASRKSAGQYFTPDDAAHFMAERSHAFPDGMWLDPCCGVGNLSWHLAAVQDDPAAFVRDHLVLIDRDETALRSAVALLGADFLAIDDIEGLALLRERACRRDFLTREALPEHDFVIVNPPYGAAPLRANLETARSKELFAYFLERVAKTSQGFIAVTPASYLAAPKFAALRAVLDRTGGGDVYVFDNVPDTLFRGYKFGSSNTSKTNFVRAAITVCAPSQTAWRITPILRWKAASRARMLEQCHTLLAPRREGPHGEWAKLAPGVERIWDAVETSPQVLKDLVASTPTDFSLTVGLTPRYYISAAYRDLDRGSKAVLHFDSEEDRDRAALVLNSSLPYIWWRALDGGVTLPRRVLYSVPVPEIDTLPHDLIERLKDTEDASITTKLNAGKVNENVKRPRDLIDEIDAIVLGDHDADLEVLYAGDMFAPAD